MNSQLPHDKVIVVAVDGPAASGKSTVSRAVARALGFNYVDSGAMYRAVTWKALELAIDVSDTMAVIGMMGAVKLNCKIVDGQARMLIDGVDPGDAIRDPRVTEKVSAVAAIPEVRQILVQLQRSLTKLGNLVMEGRDIGSVVFSDTPYKFYLDANPEVRAVRRKRDLEAMKIQATEEMVAKSIRQRDMKDSGRSASPLQIALGATVIDNSGLTADETARIVVEHIRETDRRRNQTGARTS
jgi:cytidylate kinase